MEDDARARRLDPEVVRLVIAKGGNDFLGPLPGGLEGLASGLGLGFLGLQHGDGQIHHLPDAGLPLLHHRPAEGRQHVGGKEEDEEGDRQQAQGDHLAREGLESYPVSY